MARRRDGAEGGWPGRRRRREVGRERERYVVLGGGVENLGLATVCIHIESCLWNFAIIPSQRVAH